jgi:hypothetical protein
LTQSPRVCEPLSVIENEQTLATPSLVPQSNDLRSSNNYDGSVIFGTPKIRLLKDEKVKVEDSASQFANF